MYRTQVRDIDGVLDKAREVHRPFAYRGRMFQRLFDFLKARNFRRCLIGFTPEQENPAGAFGDRIVPVAERLWNLRSRFAQRSVHATARAVVLKAVVRALHIIVEHAADLERGAHVRAAILDRMEGAAEQRREGRDICIEIIQEVSEIEGVAGIHVMAYRQEEMAAEIIDRSGILKGRQPWRRPP